MSPAVELGLGLGLCMRPGAGVKRSSLQERVTTQLGATGRHGVQLLQSRRSSHGTSTKLRFSPKASLREIEQMVRSGEIPSIQPWDVNPLLTVEGPSHKSHKLLDVRPVWEHEKASVEGSLHVPLFIEDARTDPTTLLKKWIQMGYGGMWLGQRLTMLNQDFVTQVEQAVPSKNQKIVIACGEGLRSMMAIEELRNAGYTELAWLAGGFNNVRDGDLKTIENGTKLQWATVGGASEYLLRFAALVSGVLNLIAGSNNK